jgi:hypothetical protein
MHKRIRKLSSVAKARAELQKGVASRGVLLHKKEAVRPGVICMYDMTNIYSKTTVNPARSDIMLCGAR